MSSQDFESNFEEHHQSTGGSPEKQGSESTPGVYVRADDHELPQELDMLWATSRSVQREERSPLISFIAGAVVGALLTAAVFFLLVLQHPKVKTGENEMTAPVAEELNGSSHSTQGHSGTGSNIHVPTPEMTGTNYQVKAGDSLGRIAQKFYGSSDPEYIEELQKTNHLSSPNALQLNQTLTIPPKNPVTGNH